MVEPGVLTLSCAGVRFPPRTPNNQRYEMNKVTKDDIKLGLGAIAVLYAIIVAKVLVVCAIFGFIQA